MIPDPIQAGELLTIGQPGLAVNRPVRPSAVATGVRKVRPGRKRKLNSRFITTEVALRKK